MSNRRLLFHDLFAGLLVAFAYFVFYFFVLDPQGLHFYVVFSPRTALIVFPSALVAALYWGSFEAWNKALTVYQQQQ